MTGENRTAVFDAQVTLDPGFEQIPGLSRQSAPPALGQGAGDHSSQQNPQGKQWATVIAEQQDKVISFLGRLRSLRADPAANR